MYGEKRDSMVIPVPEAESNITYYESLYPGEFKMPKQLIHIQRKWAAMVLIMRNALSEAFWVEFV